MCFKKQTLRDIESRAWLQLSRNSRRLVCVTWALLQTGSCPQTNTSTKFQCLTGLNFRDSASHRGNEPADTRSLGPYMSHDPVYYFYPGSVLCFGRGIGSYFRPLDMSYHPSSTPETLFRGGHIGHSPMWASNVCQENIFHAVTLSPACMLGTGQDGSMDTGCLRQLKIKGTWYISNQAFYYLQRSGF